MAFFSKETESAVINEKPRMESAPKKLKPQVDRGTMEAGLIAEYRAVAAEVGISEQDILVEEFRLFLAKHDVPTFNLQEVVSYMDDITAKENPTKLGWHWCPVRAKDAEEAMVWGRPSQRGEQRAQNGGREIVNISASDYYESHQFQAFSHNQFPRSSDWRQHTSPAYTRTLPLHALKKIALVEKNFTAGKVVFLVTDYVTAPHVIVNPDPFLMAVIPNSAVSHGKGRFIIDVWDEPGFGLERMVK